MKICPSPMVWNTIYNIQTEFYNKINRDDKLNIPKPPIPPILAAWHYTSDYDKLQRWKEVQLWSLFYMNDSTGANKSLSNEDFYYADLKDKPCGDVELLINNGFENFRSFQYYHLNGYKEVKNEKGVYVVCMPLNFKVNITSNTSATKEHKRRSMLYEKSLLLKKWVPQSVILYFGKAGGQSNRLRQRISQYVRYGYDEGNNHRGGRAIWQLDNSKNLLIGYVADINAGEKESWLIREFEKCYGKKPFANFL